MAKKVLVMTADQFEDSELTSPVDRLLEAGAEVDVAAPQAGTITGKKGTEYEANITVGEVNPEDYDMLLLPGGKAPARLREIEAVLDIAKAFDMSKKPIAAICHGPQILISAGLMKGRKSTSYESVASELKEAGALYEDSEVVVDGNLVTSRDPGDLDAFNREIMKKLE
jgi:protease I